MKKYQSVADYISGNGHWEEALLLLRELITSTKLEETVKWGSPVYTLNNKNVLGIAAFKSYVGLWFHQGVYLKDSHGKLMNAQEGVTKALRQWRFESLEEIKANAKIIKAYVDEAILNHENGKVLKPVKNTSLTLPEELKTMLASDEKLKKGFDLFTRSKKREFVEYIESAKRADTKQRRLEKIKPMILQGVSPNDKYRK